MDARVEPGHDERCSGLFQRLRPHGERSEHPCGYKNEILEGRSASAQDFLSGLTLFTSQTFALTRHASPSDQVSIPSFTWLAMKLRQGMPSLVKAAAIGVTVPRAPLAGLSQGTLGPSSVRASASFSAACACGQSIADMPIGMSRALAIESGIEPVVSSLALRITVGPLSLTPPGKSEESCIEQPPSNIAIRPAAIGAERSEATDSRAPAFP